MKLKFCGLNSIESLIHARELGADFAGLIFADKSPRKVDEALLSKLSSFNFGETIPVCVFVNPSVLMVSNMIEMLPNSILQFHGEETDDFCRQFHHPFWKSIAVRDHDSYLLSANFPSAQAILFETHSINLHGGTGQSFDWSMLEGIDTNNKFILAGGINQSNIKAAISMNPWCIDVNSGVESGLAIKNELLMTKLMNLFNNG